jgi:hypothetical protein
MRRRYQHLSQCKNDVDDHETRRGGALIMGGDQVHPTATALDYRQRFREPYKFAHPEREGAKKTQVFLIPGDHDWYALALMRCTAKKASL